MTTEKVKRKLTAILSADVKGYSRLMGADEVGTIRLLQTYRGVMSDLIQKKGGRVVDSPGDNVLAEFASVVDALESAVEIQRELKVRNADRSESRRMEFRIGINLGDVVEEGERIYGDGVNIAARIEGLAEGGGICISGTAFDQIGKRLPLGYEYMGEQEVKNIEKPVRVYRVLMEPEQAGKVLGERQGKGRRWSWVAAAAIVLAAGALALWNFYFRAPPIEPASTDKMAFPLPDKPSIAVLPFVNVGGDPKEDYLSDGLTEQIITSLSKSPRLFVIARNSSFVYKGKPVKIQQVSEDLGVRYVLAGSVQKSSDRVRITVQLIDAITGRNTWTEHYDREVKDIFALQDEITIEITQAMKVELTEGEQERQYVKWGTDNLKALEKNYQGTGFMRRSTKQDNDTARQFFEEAIALDPKYVWPHVLLAYTHFYDARFGWSESPAKSLQKAFELAERALAMDDANDPAHSLLGGIYLVMRQYDKAIAEAERGVALNPNGYFACSTLAAIVGSAGRWEESVQYAKQSMRLNPFPEPLDYWILGRAYFMTRQYDESISTWKKARQVNPNFLLAHVFLAACYSSLGRDAEATAAAKEVLRINPKFTTESYAKTLPYKNKADVEREVAALINAGLPDKPPLPLPDKPSIAVLPFVNMSEDKGQEFFSDGLTEEIITALSKTPKLFVIARNSTFVYKGKPVNVQQVSRELGVKYVLEGSVRRSGDQLRITAQLIDATTGNHLWAERYDREMKDIFSIQDEITMKITSAMQINLTEGEQARAIAKGTNNLEAYLKCLQAHEYILKLNIESNALGKQLAEEAIVLDPKYAPAYCALGRAHATDVWLGSSKSPLDSIKNAIELVQKAIILDDTYAEAQSLLGYLFSMIRQYDKAVALAERAVPLNPNSAECHYRLGKIFVFDGRWEESIPEFKTAIRLDPIPPNMYLYSLGLSYGWTGQYEEAITWCRKAILQEPNSFWAHIMMTVVYSLSEREQEALAAASEIIRVNPKFSLEQFEKVCAYKEKEDCDRFFGALRNAGLK